MEKVDYENARKVFNNFVANVRLDMPKDLSIEEINKRLKMMDYIVSSTYTCVDAGEKIMTDLNTSESIKDFAKIAILNHDIGRFEQIRLYGSLDDNLLASESVVNDHGELGELLLTELIKKEVPISYLQMPIRRVVRNHVSKKLDDSSLGIFSNSSVMSDDIEKILVGNPAQSRFVDAITLFVRDLEDLEIYPRLFGDNNGREEMKLTDSFNIRYNEALGKVKHFSL